MDHQIGVWDESCSITRKSLARDYFTILATLGFQLTMSESSYLVPPAFAFIVLYAIHKRSGKGKKSV